MCVHILEVFEKKFYLFVTSRSHFYYNTSGVLFYSLADASFEPAWFSIQNKSCDRIDFSPKFTEHCFNLRYILSKHSGRFKSGYDNHKCNENQKQSSKNNFASSSACKKAIDK